MGLGLSSQRFVFDKLNTSMNEFFIKDGQSPSMENVVMNKKGSFLTLQRRPGFTDFLGVDGGDACRGLYQWKMRDGKRRLIGIFGTDIRAFYNNDWNTLTTISNEDISQHFTFAPWFYHLYLTNGCEEMWKWDHITTPTQISDAPKGKFILFHKGHLFHANITNDSNINQPFRDASFQLAFSNLGLPDTYTATDFINFDGEITGIVSAPAGVLVIFNRDKTEILTGTSSSDFARTVIDPATGCTSHHGIVVAEGYIYCWSLDGALRTSGLERPKIISGDIDGIIATINPLCLPFIKGDFDKNRRQIHWLVSTTSEQGADNQAFKMNTDCVYDIATDHWEVYKTAPDVDLTSITNYEDSTKEEFLLFGTSTDDGRVLALKDESHTDSFSEDTSVTFTYETKPHFMDRPDSLKNFRILRVFMENQDRRTIPVTFYTDRDDPVTVDLPLASSTPRHRFLGTLDNSSIQYVLGTSRSGVNKFDFVDVPINRTGHYLKIKFGGEDISENIQFKLFAYQIYFKLQGVTGGLEDV